MLRLTLAAGAVVFAPLVAEAASITVTPYVPADYDSTFGQGALGTQTFESLGAARGVGETRGGLATNVGTFNTIGGIGSGGTVTQLAGNTGMDLALRSGNVFGRQSTTPGGGDWFLDSNDTSGINWSVGLTSGALFDRVVFTLMDASDVGGFLRISAGATDFEMRTTGGKRDDGNAVVVEIMFDTLMAAADITMANFTEMGGTTPFANDGFSIDGAQVFRDAPFPPLPKPPVTSPVPLPASFLMLGVALAAAGALRRRRA